MADVSAQRYVDSVLLEVRPHLLDRVRELADRRQASAGRLAPMAELIAEWRRAGYVHLTKKSQADG